MDCSLDVLSSQAAGCVAYLGVPVGPEAKGSADVPVALEEADGDGLKAIEVLIRSDQVLEGGEPRGPGADDSNPHVVALLRCGSALVPQRMGSGRRRRGKFHRKLGLGR